MSLRLRTLGRLSAIVVAFAVPILSPAQVITLTGGNSSLFQAGGGSISVFGAGYQCTAGAGTADGQFMQGGLCAYQTPFGSYMVGDNRINFQLPTDIFDNSHFLLVRGLGLARVQPKSELTVFAGTSAVQYDSPFFNGAKFSTPTGLVFWKKQISPRWTLVSDTLMDAKLTAIDGAEWRPAHALSIGFAGGVGANQPFAAVSVALSRPKVDFKAGYYLSGSQFHRIEAATPVLDEQNKENVMISYKPAPFMTVTASRQNFLVPEYPSTANSFSSVDQAGLSLGWKGTQMTASIFHSTYQQPQTAAESNHAAALVLMLPFYRHLSVTTSYLADRPKGGNATDNLLTTVNERVNAHLDLSEMVTYANGHTNVNFGGRLLLRFATVEANYETFYVPADNLQPLQQMLLLDLKTNLFGRLHLHGSTYVDPTGHMRYTAEAKTILVHEPAEHQESVPVGRFVVRGCVREMDGESIEGAAVMIDGRSVYTDSTGCFELRESRQRTHQLRVVIGEFLAGGNWQVTSAPETVTSAPEEEKEGRTIYVTVRRVRIVSENNAPEKSGESTRR